MKARTKLERRVEAITLPDISEPQKNYFISHVIKYHIYHNGKYTCPDCGKTYSDKKRKVQENVTCPHCGCKGKSVKVRNGRYTTELSYGMTTCRDGFQIIRMFVVWSHFREGDKAEYTFNEVYRNNIDEDGRSTDICVGLAHHGYNTEYSFGNPLHIYKSGYNTWATDIVPHYWYPKGTIIPKLSQRGFKGSIHDVNPRQLFEHLLQGDSKIETLFKAGYFGILERWSKSDINQYWGTIKIAIRYHYKPNNWVIWKDYIRVGDRLGMDIRNPKIICPVDLTKAHDDAMAKQRRAYEKRREQQRKEEEKRNLQSATEDVNRSRYAEHITPYMGIEVKGNGITIKPIPTSDDFFYLGKEMGQCLATMAYYKEFGSVILSAWVDGKVLENMEISLSTFRCVQCFGNNNKFTAKHEQIMELVSSKLIDEIKKCYLKSKTA